MVRIEEIVGKEVRVDWLPDSNSPVVWDGQDLGKLVVKSGVELEIERLPNGRDLLVGNKVYSS